MTTGFRRSRGGGAHAHLDLVEARMLASLAAQVVELLRDGVGGGTGVGDTADAGDPLAVMVGLGADAPLPTPDDPVLARLLPDAYPDDESEAADFRRYTEPGLRDRKVANASAVIASLVEAGADLDAGPAAEPEDPLPVRVDVELDRAGVDAWVRCLTDLRLALGTRLEVADGDEERWAQLPDDEPAKAMHDVYDWLGFIQETLVRTLR